MGVDYGDYFGTEDPDAMMDIIESECSMAASMNNADIDDEWKQWMTKISPMVNSIAKHSDRKITYAILPMCRMAGIGFDCAKRDMPFACDKTIEMMGYICSLFCMVVIPHKNNSIITYNIKLTSPKCDDWYEYDTDSHPTNYISCEEVYVKPILRPQDLSIEEIWKQFESYKEWHHSYEYHDTTMSFPRHMQGSDDNIRNICDIGDMFFKCFWAPYVESQEYQEAKMAEEEEKRQKEEELREWREHLKKCEEERQRINSLRKCEPDEIIAFNDDEIPF